MIGRLSLLLVTFLFSTVSVMAQVGTGTIQGKITDEKTGEPLPFVNVVIMQGDNQKGGATTNFDGEFKIGSVTPGEYDILAKFVGYQTLKVTGVVVSSGKITFQNKLTMTASSEMLEEVKIVDYEVPLIDKDGGASGATVTRDDIAKMPGRNATAIASTVGGVYSSEGSGDLSIRGARSEGTYYYIDGIKVRGSSNLPKSAIQEVSVITGGLPANYGDATGGVISVTTRGPSAKYFGSFEGVTSGFYFNGKNELGYDGKVIGLDKYAYNLVEGMISGPLFMKKDSAGNKTDPILGFFLSVNYTDQLDSRPLANGGAYRIKQGVRDSLLDPSLLGPLRPSGTGVGAFYNAEYLRASDFEQNRWRMNARRSALSAAGKIDVNAGPNINLTFGGSLNWNFFNLYDYNSSLFNFENFGRGNELDWRVYGRFTQRFNNTEEGSKSKVSSAYYSIMVDYSKSYRKYQDQRHEDRFFNYGYVGKFDIYSVPTYEYQDLYGNDGVNDIRVHNGFQDTLVVFTPSEVNSSLAAVTTQYFDIYEGQTTGHYENLFQIQQGNALRNGDVPQSVYGIWNNIGTPYNGYSRSEADQFRVTGSGSINVGDHSISLGFEYEQRIDRAFTSGRQGPISLWTIARQYMNSHIAELDRDNIISYEYYGTYPQITYSRLNASPGEYGGAKEGDAQTFFDYSVRDALGLDTDGLDWVNIDALDPDFFKLSMFSPDELLNQGNTLFEWYGYDHTGQKVKGTTNIDDYFTEFDENGNYARNIGAFQPIYAAGYIMDKFSFDDIIFNVGVRVDVFDANQPVLKDKYLLYEARTAAEARASEQDWAVVPESIGDDYVVYVNDVSNPTSINGFRSGDDWFNAQGVPVSDPTLLRGPNGIAPWLIDPELDNPTSSSFEDYKPQINVMPRIAFSFPISDEASFFAHYDVLTKRPTSGLRFNPIDYQFLSDRNVIINNPNLRPERTIDYALGFQQVLGRTSSLKIEAFYREQRDQVQLQNIFEAYPNTYRTYGNRDFGTVKGLTVSYDLRRTGNIRMTIAYTLQFAEGTGSGATSALSLVNSGQPNLQSIFPYSYDQRHAFNIVLDYRFGEGDDYNGPTTKKGGQILKNLGLNVVANIGSGTPYSRQQFATAAALINGSSSGLEGTLNGSRKPWTYRVDMQLDRTFNLKFGKDEDKKKVAFLNVYIRCTNLFNIINTLSVYRATGNPDDDGYLADARYQNAIQSQLDEQSFRDLYSMKVDNPFNYGIPRTIRLGVKFDF